MTKCRRPSRVRLRDPPPPVPPGVRGVVPGVRGVLPGVLAPPLALGVRGEVVVLSASTCKFSKYKNNFYLINNLGEESIID